MNKIYLEISKLSDKFREMSYGLTHDKERINDAVQELMLYFMNMNPETLKSIWEKDGEEGLIRYGAVALRRSLTSTRSSFYYKYEKYYTHIDALSHYNPSHTQLDFDCDNNYYKNISNIANKELDSYQWQKLEQIDKALDKLDSWYDREVFKLYYYEKNTLDSLAKKTKISRGSLFETIKKVRTILKKELVNE
jgi:RNA polymerase sigma factor (sigma-70 family)